MYTIYTFKVNHRAYRCTNLTELMTFAWTFEIPGIFGEDGTSSEAIAVERTNY